MIQTSTTTDSVVATTTDKTNEIENLRKEVEDLKNQKTTNTSNRTKK